MTTFYHAVQLPLFPSKVCSRCGDEKFLEQFYKARTCKDGYYTYCKACTYTRQQVWNEAHREEIQQYACDYYTAHRDDYRRRDKEFRKRHPEKTRQYSHKHNTTHREERRRQGRIYDAKRRDRRRVQRHNHWIQNLELMRQKSREAHERCGIKTQQDYKAWSQANLDKVLEKNRRYKARKLKVSIEEVSYERILERDGMYCYICEQAILPLHILNYDHVIPLIRGGSHSEENIKPTHRQCNQRKQSRLLSEMTPHQRRGVT